MADTPAFLREPPELSRRDRSLDQDTGGFAQSAGLLDNSESR
jgi:hypothetical protein